MLLFRVEEKILKKSYTEKQKLENIVTTKLALQETKKELLQLEKKKPQLEIKS